MMNLACFLEKLQHLCRVSYTGISFFFQAVLFATLFFYHHIRCRLNSFSVHLLYFLFVSTIGFLFLKISNPRTIYFEPRNLDLFFTSISATTVSSMSAIEMEVFSKTQLLILTLLMFIGGEVFTSIVSLHFSSFKLRKIFEIKNGSSMMTRHDSRVSHSDMDVEFQSEIVKLDNVVLKYKSVNFLGFVVLGYFLVIHVFGIIFVSIYLSTISSAKNVLKTKGLEIFIFSLFTTVSTFASCGFIPTNENMVVFSKNSGLLLILIPQVLFGNVLFPSCLRFSVWFLGKFVKKVEAKHLLENTREIGFLHLLPSMHSFNLVFTVLGFVVIQFIVFCSMEWNSINLRGLTAYEKVVGVFFEVVNARHTGETIVDLSTIAPAMIVLFVVMMYLPPYTSFLPLKGNKEGEKEFEGREKFGVNIVDNIILSQLSYLAIFVILICITEREKMKDDPINFSTFNIVVEVISAYGNVGFSTGYSCERQLKPDDSCTNKWYGFSGNWSDEGKVILIFVMVFGRMKKFNIKRKRSWKLL